MRFLTADLKRGLSEKTFLWAVISGILILICPACYFIYSKSYADGVNLFIDAQSVIFPFIAPILSAVPYSVMIMIEETSKYNNFIISKINAKRYYFKRFLVNGFVGGVVLFIPMVVLFLFCKYTVGYKSDIGNLREVIAMNFFFGFAWSSFSYGLTFFNVKKYIPIAAPQVIYMLLIYSVPYLNLLEFYPPLIFSPWIMPEYANLKSIVFLFFLLMGTALLMTVFGILYKLLKNEQG